ncbi:SHC-transforming protein 3 isoform X2 [Corvus hawaiiensis]|nr:SHC-transforming protein 3 isoform X2 [Corvus hawaiiensis]XP_048146978.1 SHC-transforming protein 3 isoform X2 [Corvus hawaiiensis]XP_048146979.1 SHC-transforming protein 3 isoform X2 [Corvus hawaiiensis]XP_048146980.1 SHC-transforming protein 3 isoform X2 [Corvus hawaiiensis]XP_048146981.1 SHC-transforming protein 3 isoform X2 [Corvus hawaiiensis]XP_048146982.1 SHC-transforming protein 3 isoform X2 [Corvus hawaiiensis]XP_048146983.1 SHC-transforming protein 3 isoform X2 [Corvus hawaiiensi
MSMGKKARSEEMHLASEDWNQTSSFANKSSRGWLHSSEKILGPGVTYIVKYLGCIEVLRSMRSLDFSTRMQVAREAISRVCEAMPGAKRAFKKRKPPSKVLSSILGKSNLQFAGMSIMLNISTSSLNLMNPDTKQIIANHHMQSISFASGGDPDTSDYIAYVAKDPVNRRACHILECCDGLAQDVISTIGQAFELRFKQYLQCPSKTPTFPDRMQSFEDPWTEEDIEETEHPYYNSIPNKIPPPGGFLDARLKTRLPTGADTAQSASEVGGEQIYYQSHHLGEKFSEEWHHGPVEQGSLDICSMSEDKSEVAPTAELPTYVNTQHINREALLALQADAESTFSGTTENAEASSPGKDLFDMKPFEDALKNQTSEAMLRKSTSMGCTSPPLSRAAVRTEAEELSTEPWYQGEMSRKEAEQLLKKCGDFLVRKSTTNPGSYVLTGMHKGQAKHLLLVDPEGAVRTKDRVFDSISHLINYHLENNLPIVSSVSELCLQQPAERKH